jgi:hypothetical protein
MTLTSFEDLKTAVLALTEDDRWRLKWALDEALDSYPLVTICASEIAAELRASDCLHPNLEEWARSAARQVYGRHPGDDETHGAAVDWGKALVLRYAEEEGADLRLAETV